MSIAPYQRQQSSPPATQPSLPRVVITGDLRLVVTESDAAHGPITGSYWIETQEMQEPVLVLWNAEGHVLNRQGRATVITFEVPATRTGQTLIYPVQAQVTNRQTSVVTGVFVQLLVIADSLAS
jgi:hypothetical protein